MQTQNY